MPLVRNVKYVAVYSESLLELCGMVANQASLFAVFDRTLTRRKNTFITFKSNAPLTEKENITACPLTIKIYVRYNKRMTFPHTFVGHLLLYGMRLEIRFGLMIERNREAC